MIKIKWLSEVDEQIDYDGTVYEAHIDIQTNKHDRMGMVESKEFSIIRFLDLEDYEKFCLQKIENLKKQIDLVNGLKEDWIKRGVK